MIPFCGTTLDTNSSFSPLDQNTNSLTKTRNDLNFKPPWRRERIPISPHSCSSQAPLSLRDRQFSATIEEETSCPQRFANTDNAVNTRTGPTNVTNPDNPQFSSTFLPSTGSPAHHEWRREAIEMEGGHGSVVWVVQLSDLHFSVFHLDRARDFKRYVGPTLSMINPSLVLITGDLTGEKKLGKVIVPAKWKKGVSNTTVSGGRKINEKLLSKKKK